MYYSLPPGDLGQTFNSLSTLEHYMETGGQTVLFVGDLSYADRYEYNDGVRWDSWGRLVEKSAAYQPWIWTAGNHEIEYRPDLVTYYILRHFQSTKISPVLVFVYYYQDLPPGSWYVGAFC